MMCHEHGRKHSKKSGEFCRIVEPLCAQRNRRGMFSRDEKEGWNSYCSASVGMNIEPDEAERINGTTVS
jgi:N6-adenosine-specific RNA methylase IME4